MRPDRELVLVVRTGHVGKDRIADGRVQCGVDAGTGATKYWSRAWSTALT
jgi:hypothetical protein